EGMVCIIPAAYKIEFENLGLRYRKVPKGRANSIAAKRDSEVNLRCSQVLSQISPHSEPPTTAISRMIFLFTRKSWAICLWPFFSNKAKALSSCISTAGRAPLSLANAFFASGGRED